LAEGEGEIVIWVDSSAGLSETGTSFAARRKVGKCKGSKRVERIG
jgi:hypothetical protein